jgi:hypothetical protein
MNTMAPRARRGKLTSGSAEQPWFRRSVAEINAFLYGASVDDLGEALSNAEALAALLRASPPVLVDERPGLTGMLSAAEVGELARQLRPVPPVLPDARDLILRAGLRPLCRDAGQPIRAAAPLLGFVDYAWHDDPAERAASVREGVARALLCRAGVRHNWADVEALATALCPA